MKIPFNKIYFTGNEIEYITQALKMGSISGDGYFNNKVITLLEKRLMDTKVFTTTSGTHSLELAMLLIDIKPGDEVIMPSYTFTSTANAVMLYGGVPVFVDIYENSLSIDVEEVEKNINDRTKAIIPVHYGGIGCEMDGIMKLAEKHNLYVVEDAAQALGSKYLDKSLGTWGHIGCYSFHSTKNYISGEGGALSINIKDSKLIERAEIIRQKGTNRNRFLKGEIDKYSWVDIGSSYAPSDVLMAMLYSQLLDMDEIILKREKLVKTYIYHLQKFVDTGIITSMTNIPKDYKSNYHNFYIILNNEKTRDYIMDSLKENNIQAYIHFVPLHSSPMGASLGYNPLDLPITERVGNTLLRLPLYTDMKQEEIDYVIERLCKVLEGYHG
jgi:dTDP-4-amino-4,6-dideoxygalactose transaminase